MLPMVPKNSRQNPLQFYCSLGTPTVCTLKIEYQQYGSPPLSRARCYLWSTEEAAANSLAMTLFGVIMRRHVRPAHKTGGAALGLKSVETLGICPWRLASLIRIVSLAPGAEKNSGQQQTKSKIKSKIEMRKLL